ncbi:CaiB/BaiF CoA-transferase family protein [Mitsuaria sp. GD03876]|uniref:CaiB/BaiF CoA transferase family protein n=1 Tax=Mitsuaria sp. GD03876 TaxID=2975399 RepID=UPI002448D208|nr:CaiB/BaiF CoA-transferase family protein [Mitsuaria sp. GD03876]MDH0867686.1 CoA transferase [Mitsuaria sp. GD03876]
MNDPTDAGTGGPLSGLRIVEFAGIGPAPFAGMVLADFGAEVTVIERPGGETRLGGGAALNRGKTVVEADLKSAAGLARVRDLVAQADALVEGFRPGVMERLGLGPDTLLAAHPRLVYARLTGWGQTGPLARTAGHDINYVALTGLMPFAARPGQAPALAATLLGDIGGGALTMLFGLMCALWESKRSGRGQVIDAAIVDGVGYMGTLIQALRAGGHWNDDPSGNFFLHRSHFYECFECADGRWLSLGAIEAPFYDELIRRLELPPPLPQDDPAQWPALRERVAARIRERTLAHWVARFEDSDACVAPVLTAAEAPHHPHQQARRNFFTQHGHAWPMPAPKLSRTPATPGAAAARNLDDRVSGEDDIRPE